ncbi:T3SS effector HopA1 family protein [Georgenia satyanarayanai]|uniref:T3SS effector HopA1 family protein n=1 Tax=Georgenia satyanarayanai TaxID=860221 RepID=UPI00203C2E6E|nr:T3SS effector HopA1 family protein [Georgenia satyanarayanai]MCM3659982.1 T3SS effector HopA1 family protein [Georgenia satyanarayanai]
MTRPATTAVLTPAHVLRQLERLAGLVAGEPAAWAAAVPGAATLAEALYARWYTEPPAVIGPARVADPPLHAGSLVAVLRAARTADRPAAEPWVVLAAAPDGSVMAQRAETVRQVRSGEYVARARPGVPPAPGELVEVLAPLEMVDAERGLWWTFTDVPPEPPFGRVYLDARAATVGRVVRAVGDALGGTSHQLKCPVLPGGYARVDAVVVYHRRADRPAVLDALRNAPLECLLDDPVPPLTCPLGPGVSWADDPGTTLSFGEHVCRALAAGIERSAAGWAAATVEQRTGRLLSALTDAGVDPGTPWEAGT